MRYIALFLGVFIGCYVLGMLHADYIDKNNPLIIIFVAGFTVVIYFVAFISEELIKKKSNHILSVWQSLIIGVTYVPIFFLVYGLVGTANIQYLMFLFICSILLNPYLARKVFKLLT